MDLGCQTVSADASGGDVEIDISPEGLVALNESVGDHYLITGRLPDLHPMMPGMPPAVRE